MPSSLNCWELPSTHRVPARLTRLRGIITTPSLSRHVCIPVPCMEVRTAGLAETAAGLNGEDEYRFFSVAGVHSAFPVPTLMEPSGEASRDAQQPITAVVGHPTTV
ncbi:hypothetical protein U9M48_037046 [Paspalum notatum var. saurae]|uniref:Uncharacterized protein n=1 Tax=Paspalum notatum var. saurae TaxID=547442 RepID=A0AAQ3X9J3_PASNO